jgi:hypothetical protein
VPNRLYDFAESENNWAEKENNSADHRDNVARIKNNFAQGAIIEAEEGDECVGREYYRADRAGGQATSS